MFTSDSPAECWVEEKQNSLLPVGPGIKRFVAPLNSKNKKKNYEKFTSLAWSGTQIYRGFKVHDLITSESKVQVADWLKQFVFGLVISFQ